ncbi:MAG TPA: sulfatase-like hydrolase/transferase [Gammaproteobacteria bacterium]
MAQLTRKEFIKRAGASAAALMASSVLPGFGSRPARAQPSTGRPNILFICMDQLRSWLDLPQELPLPAHRRLLDEGRAFRFYHVHQAPCAPSRSSFYTGQHIQKTGIYTNPPSVFAEITPGEDVALELPLGFPTIGTLLREQGYYTAYKGKWHLSVVNQRAQAAAGRGRYPIATDMLEGYGFSDYNHDGEHAGLSWEGFTHDEFIAADAINLLRRLASGRSEGRPWFLAVNFINPHDIMYFDAAGRGGINRGAPMLGAPGVPLYDQQWDFPLPRSYYEDDLSTKPRVHRPANDLDEAGWLRYQNYYFNCIRDVDRHIAKVLDEVDRLGLADSTIVVLTSDHGERGGAHGGMRGKGADIYKETVRVPLIVRHPDVSEAGLTDALASGIDLAPTLLGFAGLDDAARAERYPFLHGIDLGPVIADPRARTERDRLGILFNYGTPGAAVTPDGPAEGNTDRALIRGVFDGRYKFGRYFRVTEHHKPLDWDTLVAHNDLELYDTAADPDELINLAYRPEAHEELILALNAKVNALMDREVGVDDGSMYPGDTALYNRI